MSDYSKITFVSIGSNLNDPLNNVLKSIDVLKNISREKPLVSSLWLTEPVDCPAGSPPFINAVIGIYFYENETPETLLDKLLNIEVSFGRKPKNILNEPRPIDLDLLSFGYEKRTTDKLILPHPRATKRAFVLAPLCEIAPDFVFPGQLKTVKELLVSLEGVKRIS